MIKSFKLRLYPTPAQATMMRKHIGCCRYIWNHMLNLQQTRYEAGEKHLSAFDTIKLLTPLKQEQELEWLKEVSNTSLQIICQDLGKSYKGLFAKRSKRPRFKSKKDSKQNFPIRAENLYFTADSTANIEKVGKMKFKTDFNLPTGKGHKFTNPRISYIRGKWMLSFGMTCESQAPVLTDTPMGIDLGITTTAVVAFGDETFEYQNINKSRQVRQYQQKIKRTQRSISRKYEASKKRTGYYTKTNNIIKEEDKLRRLYARVTGIRQNYIHQMTHSLVSLLPCEVIMEDLNVTDMMKNRHLSKAIAQQCFSEIIRQMTYKCEWRGIRFTQVGRFYPSSKTCSGCGCVKHDLKLKDRTYACHECGFEIDRDLNAAINLMRYSAQTREAEALRCCCTFKLWSAIQTQVA